MAGWRLPRKSGIRSHHVQEQTIELAVKQAVRCAGLTKAATPHTFATHLLEGSYDI